MLRSLDSAHTSLQLSRLWSKELLQTTVNTEHDLFLILSQTSDGFTFAFSLCHTLSEPHLQILPDVVIVHFMKSDLWTWFYNKISLFPINSVQNYEQRDSDV